MKLLHGSNLSRRVLRSSNSVPTHIFSFLHKCGIRGMFADAEDHMGRISIDVTDDEHKRLKAMAALRGKSIKDYVLERTLATSEAEHAALQELEKLLDNRIRAAQAGAISRRTASEVFAEAAPKKSR